MSKKNNPVPEDNSTPGPLLGGEVVPGEVRYVGRGFTPPLLSPSPPPPLSLPSSLCQPTESDTEVPKLEQRLGAGGWLPTQCSAALTPQGLPLASRKALSGGLGGHVVRGRGQGPAHCQMGEGTRAEGGNLRRLSPTLTPHRL